MHAGASAAQCIVTKCTIEQMESSPSPKEGATRCGLPVRCVAMIWGGNLRAVLCRRVHRIRMNAHTLRCWMRNATVSKTHRPTGAWRVERCIGCTRALLSRCDLAPPPLCGTGSGAIWGQDGSHTSLCVDLTSWHGLNHQQRAADALCCDALMQQQACICCRAHEQLLKGPVIFQLAV